MQPDRRKFLKAFGKLGVGLTFTPYFAPSLLRQVHSAENPLKVFFDESQRKTLSTFVDSIFPRASELGTIRYIEQLLTAFDHNPPRIYAGGPFSGRKPFSENGKPTSRFPENQFTQFLPLTRAQEYIWKKSIKELSDLLLDGLSFASYFPIEILPGFIIRALMRFIGEDFRDALVHFTVESIFVAPEYGGNQDLHGWHIIRFEGDTLPLGFSMYDGSRQQYVENEKMPVSRLDPNEDPHPLSTEAHLLLNAFALLREGKKFY